MADDGPRPILDVWPRLTARLPFARLAELPTPVARLAAIAEALGKPTFELWEKRDDLTSPLYGGNKVRTLEVLFADALAKGSTHIYSTGAYGSNHAAASALHAPRVGLVPGLVVYPQPHSGAALENLEVVLSRSPRPPVRDLPHWSALPWGMWQAARDAQRRGERATIMMPGGAVPLGALGYVSAAFELALQVEAGELPAPARIMLAIGSNCTSAGLLLGFALAARRGVGFAPGAAPLLHCVRVTPWPVTSYLRVLNLAHEASALLAQLTGDPRLELSRRELREGLFIDGRYLGPGYGFPTPEGREAMQLWAEHAGHALETTYSGKAAAAVLDQVRDGGAAPVVYWATKSSAPLPPVDPGDLEWAPPRMQRWMVQARQL